jgi:methyltransferase (TIGR00027 family)
MDKSREAVASTGLLVAAIRAKETASADPLFTDPFAAKLAGESGMVLLAKYTAESGEQSTAQIVIRTRFWDEALLRATGVATQVVILAAGMDARAYRLPWPDGITTFELDQPAVITAKADKLGGDQPRCHRVPIGIDLAEDWPTALLAAGLNPDIPTAWLIEGLLQYLDEGAVRTLFERVNALSAPGSTLLYDIVGKTLLEGPYMAPVLAAMAAQGSPWLFGTDAPAELAERHGWQATVTDIAEPGNRWNRWFAPAVPLDVPDVPRGYFVEATR